MYQRFGATSTLTRPKSQPDRLRQSWVAASGAHRWASSHGPGFKAGTSGSKVGNGEDWGLAVQFAWENLNN